MKQKQLSTIVCTTGTSVAGPANPMAKHQSPGAYGKAILERVEKLRRELSSKAFLTKISAETNSLRAMDVSEDDKLILLHTETKDGQICAHEVAGILEHDFNIRPVLRSIKGLQVTDALRFRREGIQDLVRVLDELHTEAAGNGSKLSLNITGGFKGVVPYVTLFGLLRRLDVVYLFEQSDSLICLPPAPLSFDYERLSRARVAIGAIADKVSMTREDFYKLIPGLPYPERDWYGLLLEDAADAGTEHVTLSPLGLLFENDARAEEAKVYISKNAQEQFDCSEGDCRAQFAFMLLRVGDPLWRRGKVHIFHGTDLRVFKPGATSERIACIIRDGCVYVCELLKHDEYERVLQKRKESQYKLGEFSPWDPPDDLVVPKSDEEILTRVLEENKALRDQSECAKTQKQKSDNALNALKKKLGEQTHSLQKTVDAINRLTAN